MIEELPEPCVSGKSELIRKALPGYKQIDWDGGKANVTY
jgi:hypothetical protein